MKSKKDTSSQNFSHKVNEDKRERLVFETIRDISSDGFLVVDEKGIIIDINQAYCQFLGISRENCLGRPVTELIENSKLPEILRTGQQEINVVHRLTLSEGSQ